MIALHLALTLALAELAKNQSEGELKPHIIGAGGVGAVLAVVSGYTGWKAIMLAFVAALLAGAVMQWVPNPFEKNRGRDTDASE